MTREEALPLPRGTLLIVAAFPPSAIVRLVEVEQDTALIEFEYEHHGYAKDSIGRYRLKEMEPMTAANLDWKDAEKLVLKKYPDAFPFLGAADGFTANLWSICNGTRTPHGNIRIPNVGFHESIEAAWIKAAEIVRMKLPTISEDEFQAQVIEYAKLRGWLIYHTRDSRRSAAGFPDLVLVRDGYVCFVELKTDKGKLTFEQEVWVNELRAAKAECFVWRPSDWQEIEELLR